MGGLAPLWLGLPEVGAGEQGPQQLEVEYLLHPPQARVSSPPAGRDWTGGREHSNGSSNGAGSLVTPAGQPFTACLTTLNRLSRGHRETSKNRRSFLYSRCIKGRDPAAHLEQFEVVCHGVDDLHGEAAMAGDAQLGQVHVREVRLPDALDLHNHTKQAGGRRSSTHRKVLPSGLSRIPPSELLRTITDSRHENYLRL
jgi:hypothetical protein